MVYHKQTMLVTFCNTDEVVIFLLKIYSYRFFCYQTTAKANTAAIFNSEVAITSKHVFFKMPHLPLERWDKSLNNVFFVCILNLATFSVSTEHLEKSELWFIGFIIMDKFNDSVLS